MMQRLSHLLASLACLSTLAFAGGCLHSRDEATTRPTATEIDPATAQPAYWWDQPASVTVAANQYDFLFQQCEQTLRAKLFTIDRTDYRAGILTTSPLISKQAWEFWRNDVKGGRQIANSTIATYRRTVRWECKEAPGGQFLASPKVVVERFTAEPNRITTVVSYQGALSSSESQVSVNPRNLANTGREHWYAVGRDHQLEESLARDLERRLHDK